MSKAEILAAAALLTIWIFAQGANAVTTTLTQMQTTPVAGGIYTVQNNKWGSGAAESTTTNGNADFTVANSAIDNNATNGEPRGYPSIYQGCHSEVATNVSVGGAGYDVWEGSQGSFDTVSYTMTTPQTSVSGLDLAPLAQNAVSRGYLSSSCYLIDIEPGAPITVGFNATYTGSNTSPSSVTCT
jgi:hypothetical protein